jgi:glycosyltransferase involved in cell wall biosynthesis
MKHKNSANMVISVITVCFNAVDYIEQTITSVMAQTYPNLEYIIIDGGSLDGTVEIIRKYESRLAYWHSQPDRGIAHAFNLGLAQAHGDWIVCLNADDILLTPTVMEQMAPHLLLHQDDDVVFGQMVSLTRDKHPKLVPLCRSCGGPWRWQEFRRVNRIPHPATFTHRHYFDRVGCFDESFRIAMDYELFLVDCEPNLFRLPWLVCAPVACASTILSTLCVKPSEPKSKIKPYLNGLQN